MNEFNFGKPTEDTASWASLQGDKPGSTTLTPDNEQKAIQLYNDETSNHPVIHCNRFPTWAELSEVERQQYRDRV